MVLWCWYILDDKIHSLQAFVCIIQIINLRYNEFQNLLVDGVGIVFKVICFNRDTCILLSCLRFMVVDLDYHWNRNDRRYIFLLATSMILSCLSSSLDSELLKNDNFCFCESLVTLEMYICVHLLCMIMFFFVFICLYFCVHFRAFQCTFVCICGAHLFAFDVHFWTVCVHFDVHFCASVVYICVLFCVHLCAFWCTFVFIFDYNYVILCAFVVYFCVYLWYIFVFTLVYICMNIFVHFNVFWCTFVWIFLYICAYFGVH